MGNDISWPQCGGTYPTSPAFGIVGINGGRADDQNQCFGPSSSYPSYRQSELYWAVATSSGADASAGQPKASIYVNTADPGNAYDHQLISDWPTSGSSTEYGTCTTTTVTFHGKAVAVGENSPACAYQYGYDMATKDLGWLATAATGIDTQQSSVTVSGSASAYPWWLDVETGNTWQSGTSGVAMNVADLNGVVAALESHIASVGVYSTRAQWDQIAGTSASGDGLLSGLPDWLAGASTQAGAKSMCASSATAFTGGTIELTQWTTTFDDDWVCALP